MKIQIQIERDGKVNVMDEEYDPVPGATAEIKEEAEGQTWIDVMLP